MNVSGGALLVAEGLRLQGIGSEPINLVVERGARIAVLGDAGSGRGRLLSTLARLEAPAGGRIRWMGLDVTRRPRWLMPRSLRESVILIWDNPYVLFEQSSTVRQIVESGVRLAKAGLTPAALDLQVKSLSGLSRVRLALAYAAQRRPHVILVDDVFHHLAPAIWPEVVAACEDSVTEESAVVIASRYPSALRTMQEALMLSDGDLVDPSVAGDVLSRTVRTERVE